MLWPGYAHIVVVHVPLGVLVTAIGMEAYTSLRRRPLPEMTWLFSVGVAGAWLACLTGLATRAWQARQGILDDLAVRQMTNWHLGLSVMATVIFSMALWLRVRHRSAIMSRWMWGMEAVGIVLLLVTAHLGGVLVHGA